MIILSRYHSDTETHIVYNICNHFVTVALQLHVKTYDHFITICNHFIKEYKHSIRMDLFCRFRRDHSDTMTFSIMCNCRINFVTFTFVYNTGSHIVIVTINLRRNYNHSITIYAIIVSRRCSRRYSPL